VIDAPSHTAPDLEIAEWLSTVANTEHHPTSTCRMGTDEMAVADGVGLVRGVERLRIVDGSILPRIPSGNVNAPIIMVAEKLADAIVRKNPLRPFEPGTVT
ncbi:MAG: GMC oxidoreductase, partial [Steroidobacteraceae bacterium]